MLNSKYLTLALLASALNAGLLGAQEIPRERYLTHLPLGMPRLTPQNEASVAVNLWGDPSDPSYRDETPRDGIDDRRFAVLQSLAVRFAPFLVQNTGDFPMNFDVFVENRETFPLIVDTWDVTGEEQTFVGSREVNFSALDGTPCRAGGLPDPFASQPMATGDATLEDCKLLALLDEFSPGGGETRSLDAALVRSNPSLVNVLFFNMPGDGPRTWKEAYRPEYDRTPPARRAAVPHAYVHPFMVEVDGEGGGPGYELLLQYWFYYPTNDSGMDHEGDWEHINVAVSPRSMVEGALTAETVGRILDGSLPAGGGDDPLVIKRVDYYFHHFVWPVDFSSPNVYLPKEAWKAEVASRPQTRFREREIWEATRYMAYVDDAETEINTHPFGYIGGDNKGLNQALESPGGSNRDPHGTYPFPGRYNNVGPGGTTDQLSSYVDSRRYLRRLRAGQEDMGPDFRKESVLGLADPARLRILPDWERLVPLVRSDAEVRRKWAWLVLPARWGYPATRSPFSGVLENYNTGNVAPQGPSYNDGWNLSGPGPGFLLYEPHAVPSVFPLQVQDNFRNDLGFLNLTVPVLFNLPPLDFAARLAAYPFRVLLGRRDPVYYPKDGIPFRFVGVSSGVSIQRFGSEFEDLAIAGENYETFLGNLLVILALSGYNDETVLAGGGSTRSTSVGPFVQVPFYLGGRFSSENTVRNVRATFGTTLDFNNIPSYSYSHDLNFWEYAGSIRYSLTTSHVQPYVKAGYGWSWYRLENIQANGIAFAEPTTKWYGPKSVVPNTLHYGLGVEFIPWKRVGTLPGGVDAALRVEYGRYSQHLDLELGQIPLNELNVLYKTLADVPGRGRATRSDLTIGLTVSF